MSWLDVMPMLIIAAAFYYFCKWFWAFEDILDKWRKG